MESLFVDDRSVTELDDAGNLVSGLDGLGNAGDADGDLVEILDGDKGIPDLKSLLFSFPKPVFTYAHAYQRPLDAMKPNPELLTGLLRIIQEDR